MSSPKGRKTTKPRPCTWNLLVDIWVDPAEAFRSVLEGPIHWATFVIPWLLFVVVASIDLMVRSEGLADLQGPSEFDSDPEGRRAYLRFAGVLSLLIGTLVSFLMSTLLFWALARFLAKKPIRFRQAVIIMGLSLGVPILGGIATQLLVQSTGDFGAQFSLGYVFGMVEIDSMAKQILVSANFFHLWYLATISIGLSALTDLSCRLCFGICGLFWLIPKLLAF